MHSRPSAIVHPQYPPPRGRRRARIPLAWALALAAALATMAASPAPAEETAPQADTALHAKHLLVIVGAPGEPRYEAVFRRVADLWLDLGLQAGASTTTLGLDEEPADRSDKQRVEEWIGQLAAEQTNEAWIVYVGHGSFDGRDAKLNLRGPDLSADELAAALDSYEERLVFIHGGSASAPFLPALSGPRRIIITATRSENQINYARFGEAFAEAMASDRSDLDLDGEVSLLEAFITASRQVATYYQEAGRLATEHALLDDTGDGRGVGYDAFDHLRPRKGKGGDAPRDGLAAKRVTLIPSPATLALSPEEQTRRDRLEAELETLRERRDALPESDYLAALERIFLQLADLYLSRESEPLTEPPDS